MPSGGLAAVRKAFCIAEKQEERSKKDGKEAHALAKGPIRAFNRVVNYCTEPSCRRAMLLEHFGEKLQQCTGCDYCDDPTWAERKVLLSNFQPVSLCSLGSKNRKRINKIICISGSRLRSW